MGKIKLICMVSTVMLLFTSNVYAGSASVSSFEKAMIQQDNAYPSISSFEITSGLPKGTESTFDESRTIVGTAPKDTIVMFEVYAFNEEDESFKNVESYETTVGASGVFSKSIDLVLGQNYILITANTDSSQSFQAALINRKNIEIKTELEQSIVLPGQNTVYSRVSPTDAALLAGK